MLRLGQDGTKWVWQEEVSSLGKVFVLQAGPGAVTSGLLPALAVTPGMCFFGSQGLSSSMRPLQTAPAACGMCWEPGQALLVQLLCHGHWPWLLASALVPLESRDLPCFSPRKGRQNRKTSRKPCWVPFISLQVPKGFSSWSQTCHKM